MKAKQYIIKDPDILGGKPVINGTRVPVSRIVFLLRDGYTPRAIHMEYPHISTATINGTISEIAKQLDN